MTNLRGFRMPGYAERARDEIICFVCPRERKNDDRIHTMIDSSSRPIERGDPGGPKRRGQLVQQQG